MSCKSINGILHNCSSNQGGIRNIYISNEKIDEIFTLKNILLTPEFLHPEYPPYYFMNTSFKYVNKEPDRDNTNVYMMHIVSSWTTGYEYGFIPKGSFIKHMVYEKGNLSLQSGYVGYTPNGDTYYQTDPDFVNFYPYDTATEEDDKNYYIIGRNGIVTKGNLSGKYFRTPCDIDLENDDTSYPGQFIAKLGLTPSEISQRIGKGYEDPVGFYWGDVFSQKTYQGCPDMYLLYNPNSPYFTGDVHVDPVFCGDKINWFQYHIKRGQSNFSFTQNKDVCKTELKIKLNQMDESKREELMTLLRSDDIHVIVVDNNGKNWILGANGNLEVEEITGQTGEKKDDGNYYEIKFTDYSHDIPRTITDDELNRCNIHR